MSRPHWKKERRRPPKKRPIKSGDYFQVKVQVSQAQSNAFRHVLIYTEDRRIEQQWADETSVANVLGRLGNDPKGFFSARIDEHGNLALGDRIADQSW